MDPTGSEIQQHEIPEKMVVPVQIEGPVKTQALPALNVSFALVQVPFDGKAYRILKKDPRRARAWLRGLGGTVWLATSEGGAIHKQGFEMSAQVNLDMRHSDEVWGLADTVDARVSVMSELWSD